MSKVFGGQCKKVYDHMREHGSITAYRAMRDYGCYRLAARINDLRKMGYAIHTELVRTKKGHHAKYTLED